MTKQTGFTLIELLLVLAIIGIISAIAIPALLGQRQSAKNSATASQAANIAAAIQVAFDQGEKPAAERPAQDLAALADQTTATEVVTAVLARDEFTRLKNPFTNGPAYINGAPAVAGDSGINLVTENAQTVADISYMIKTSTGDVTKRLEKSPETSLEI